MEHDYDCEACGKPFKAMNEIAEPKAPEVATVVHCPSCEATNSITWPKGARLVVVAKYPQPTKR